MPDNEFLEWNFKNILTNLFQAEDHLKVLKPTGNPEHHSCVQKHLLIASGELGEAISHSSTARPKISEHIKGIKSDTDILVVEFENGITDSIDALKKVRALRKNLGELNPAFDTSSCKSCGKVEGGLEKIKNASLADNASMKEKVYKGVYHNIIGISNGENMTDMKSVGTITGANVVGKAVTMVGDYIDAQTGKTGETILKRPSTYLNLLGGISGIVAALYLVKKEKFAVPLTITSSYLLTKSLDYAAEATRGGAVLGSGVRIMGKRAGMQVPQVGAVPEFTDRGLINVD